MKKLILFFIILLSGCTITDSLEEVNIDNENCIGIRRFKVLQAIYHNTGLAFECLNPDCDRYYLNNLDFIHGDNIGEDLYDGMIYEVPTDKCAVRHGVYKYETKEGNMKTVSQIIFEYKNYPKTEDEIEERINKSKKNMFDMCQWIFKDENIKQDEEYCTCYANSFVENNGSASAIKRECKKSPKVLTTLKD